MGEKMMNIIGVDVSTLPDQSVKVLAGCESKIKCRNKVLQRILIKVFGLKPVYETKQAKVITTRAEDCPKDWDGSLEITFGENAD